MRAELLKERETELVAAVAETQSARERIEALESEKAAVEPVLASVRAEAEESLVRVQALEAEKAAWEHPAFALTEETVERTRGCPDGCLGGDTGGS